MSGVSRVRATKVRQTQPAKRSTKAGRPFNGPNLVAQHEGSAKKAARKASASRRAS